MNEDPSKRKLPEGFHTLTPYIAVPELRGLLDFIETAIGAREKSVTKLDDGTIKNAEYWIGDSILMLGELPDDAPFGPRTATLYMYVDDCDSVYERALAAGAKSLMEPRDTYYGDRNCGVEDPWGNQWWIATHLEDLSEEEMHRRMKEMEQSG